MKSFFQNLTSKVFKSAQRDESLDAGNSENPDSPGEDTKDNAIPRPTHPAMKHWDSHAKQNRILLIFLVVITLVTILSHVRFVSILRNENRVVVLDSSDTFYVSPLEVADLQSPVFARTAVIATEVILNRTPAGIKMRELTGILTEGAFTRLQEEVEEQLPDLRAQSMVWEPVVESVEAQREQRGLRIYSVSGELIQVGAVDGQAFIDPLPFRLLLGIKPNGNLGQRRQFPFQVASYRLSLGGEQ